MAADRLASTHSVGSPRLAWKQAAMSFIGLLRTLEQITRPPRRGAESEDGEPVGDIPDVCPNCGAAVDATEFGDFQCSKHCGQIWIRDYCPADTSNPTEPGLTSDELVGVRGLLQERYQPDRFGREAVDVLSGSFWCRTHHNLTAFCPEDCGTRLFRAAACTPSPTIVQSAPPPTVDGEGPASVRDIQPSPEAGRSRSDLPLRVMTNDPIEMFNEFILRYVDPSLHAHFADDDDNDAEYVRRLITHHPEDAVAEWTGWAVPAICTVLHEHRPFQRRPIASNDDGRVYCSDEDGNIHRRFDDYQAWLEHIGPILATALAPHQK